MVDRWLPATLKARLLVGVLGVLTFLVATLVLGGGAPVIALGVVALMLFALRPSKGGAEEVGGSTD
jgi:hypothetical protein